MRYFGWLIAGFALYRLSGLVESLGDAAPFAPGGVSSERAMFHGTALIVLLAGLACFIRAGVLIWRSLRGGGPPAGPAPEPETDEAPAFDPDAALARYLQGKGETPRPPEATGAGPGGFGRRGL